MKWINKFLFGCGVFVGIIFLIDCDYLVELFGFDVIYENSLDGVSDRDFILEFLSNSSMLMMYLFCFFEEIILWCL